MASDWNQVLNRIRSGAGITGPKEALLKELKLVQMVDTPGATVAKLSLRSKLSMAMVERLLLPELKTGLEAHTGKPALFEFEVASQQESFPLEQLDPSLGPSHPSEPHLQAVMSIRFREKLTLDPALTFDTFVETEESCFALAALREFSLFTELDFSVAIMHGPAGVGKSHLLHATGASAKRLHPHTQVKIITGDEFITEFQAACAKRNMADFRRRWRLETDLLLLDDLHSLGRAQGTQEELFNLMNHYTATGRRMVITSDRAIHELDGVEERIRSRLSGGLVLEMCHPSVQSRVGILTRKLHSRGIQISNKIIEDVARRTGPCVRSLEGVVNTLTMLARSGNLNHKTLARFVGEAQPEPPKANAQEIMAEVARAHSLTIQELKGRSRSRTHILARRQSMRLLKEKLGLSISEIGRLHGRDHSTVINALRNSG